MEKFALHGLLYDFYGELLTEHQRQIYEDAVYNDMSLGEIADIQGISRQGVHDLLKRCDRILEDYEYKLHLVERFDNVKKRILEIDALADELEEAGLTKATKAPASPQEYRSGQCEESEQQSKVRRIKELAGEILGEL